MPDLNEESKGRVESSGFRTVIAAPWQSLDLLVLDGGGGVRKCYFKILHVLWKLNVVRFWIWDGFKFQHVST